MMKKSVLIAALGLFSLNTMAQDAPKEEGFVFTTVKENPITSIKNQNRSSTCWSFSSLGFLESELLRMGKGEYDLSEMFVVHHTMVDRGQNYVRYHGDSSFSPGGSFYDIMFCLKNYGLVPQEAMPGIMYGDTLPVHNELDAVAGAYTNAIAKGKLTKLSPVWKNGLSAIYDTYLGKCPEKFTYKGKEYTPKTFGESLGIKSGRDLQARKLGVPCENITITNCTMLSGHGGVVIGSEMSGGVKKVTISNCVFDGTDRGIRLKSTRGRGGIVEDIRVSNIVMSNIKKEAIVLNLKYSKMPAEPKSDRTPEFRNIYVSGVTVCVMPSTRNQMSVKGGNTKWLY